MNQNDTPTRIIKQFAQSGLKNTIPDDPSTTPGAASFALGFPPLTMTAIADGGVPPTGQDFNGIFFAITNWIRFLSAGSPLFFDADFAAGIGGYPKGALVADPTPGVFHFSTVDGNTSVPGAAGANWSTAKLLQSEVSDLSAYLSQAIATINSAIAGETAQRQAQDEALLEKFSNYATIAYLSQTINTLNAAILDAENRITAEAATRTQNVSDLQTSDVNLSNRINTEAAARTAADNALGSRIDGEAAARNQNVSDIEGQVGNLSDRITGEAAARNQNVTDLQSITTSLSDRISAEAGTRTTNVADLSSAINSEIAARVQQINDEVKNRTEQDGIRPTFGYFSASLALNGFARFPSQNGSAGVGLIVQWGSGTTQSGYKDILNFPITFPNGVFSIIASEGATGGWGTPTPSPTIFGTEPINNTGFYMSCVQLVNGPQYAAGITYRYIALGW